MEFNGTTMMNERKDVVSLSTPTYIPAYTKECLT